MLPDISAPKTVGMWSSNDNPLSWQSELRFMAGLTGLMAACVVVCLGFGWWLGSLREARVPAYFQLETHSAPHAKSDES